MADASSSSMVDVESNIPLSTSKVSVTLQVLYGPSSASPSACGGTCSLLTIGGTRLLLDCGWDGRFDERDVAAALLPLARPGALDGVLISQTDVEHCGALPLLYGRFGCRAPVYLTLPILRLGQMALYDVVLSRSAAAAAAAGAGAGAATALRGLLSDAELGEFAAYSVDDVKACFTPASFGGPVVQLRFLEEHSVRGAVTVSPSNSGHALGGSIWRIAKGTETVVYAPVFNHRVERHLGRAELLQLFRSPSALIAGAWAGSELVAQQQAQLAAVASATAASAAAVAPPAAAAAAHVAAAAARAAAATAEAAAAAMASSGKTDALLGRELASACLATLRAGGHVLLPSDSAGRALELLLRLDQALGIAYPFPVFFLGRVVPNVVEYANSLLEYMSERVSREFADGSEHRAVPFEFRPQRSRVRCAASLAEVTVVAAHTPVVVVSSFAGLEAGFARDLFRLWAGDARNAVFLTSRALAEPGSLSARLLAALDRSPGGSAEGAAGLTVAVESVSIVPLAGLELKRFRDAREEEVRKAARAAATARARSDEADELAETSAASAAASAAAFAAAAAAPTAPATAAGAAGGGVGTGAGLGAGPSLSSPAAASAALLLPSSSPLPPLALPRAAPAPAGLGADDEDDDPFDDDEETVAQLDYVDDAVSYSITGARSEARRDAPHFPGAAAPATFGPGSASPTPGPAPVPGRFRRGGGGRLAARFAMYGRDEQAAGAVGGAASSSAAAAAARLAAPAFRSEASAWGATVNPLDFDEGDEARVAQGSGLAHGTMLAINLGLPAAVAAQARLAQGAGALGGAGGAAADAAAADDALAGRPLPTKRVRQSSALTIACRVRYFNLEGRADAVSVLNTLEGVAPLKLVFLHGPAGAAAALAEAASRFCASVFAPQPQAGAGVGAAGGGGAWPLLDLGSNTAQVVMRIAGPFFASIGLQPLALAASHEVAFVRCEVVATGLEGAAAGAAGSPRLNAQGLAEGLMLTYASGGADDAGHAPSLLRPGPVRLAEVRKRLQACGVQTRLVDGAIVTAGGVIVRRGLAEGAPSGFALEIEGPACADYFAARDVLYGLYTMV